VAEEEEGWLKRRMGGSGKEWVAEEREGWLMRGMGG
jgi:hypothetical protein